MPEAYQTAFWDAAVIAADEANALDRSLEADYTQKLLDAGMKIYTPNAAEKALWVAAGEGIWSEVGGDIDPAVLDKLRALRG